jgi:hypothetical protein
LAITYLTALCREKPGTKDIAWIGAVALIPSVLFVIVSGTQRLASVLVVGHFARLGWTAALLLPLAGRVLRRRAAWMI